MKEREIITIGNKGKFIVDTNYFNSESAKLGYVYVSWNAGACRLLVPDASLSLIDEIRTGNKAIVMAGPFDSEAVETFNRELDERSISANQEHGLTEYGFYGHGLDIVFDDGTTTPFSILTHPNMVDRQLPPSDHCTELDMLVYARSGVVHQLKCFYLVVDSIPSAIPTIL